MDSETKFAAENPVIFSAQFSILPARLAMERHGGSLPSAADCSMDCSNQNYQRKCIITSPGYPGVYPRGIRCRISLESTAGRFKIGGVNDDVYNLMNYTVQDGCRTENCEYHLEDDIGDKNRHDDVDESITTILENPHRHARNLARYEDYRFDEDDEMIIGSDVKQRRINARRKNDRIDKRRKWKNRTHRKEADDSFPQRDRKVKNLKIFDDIVSVDNLSKKTGSLFDHRFHRKHKPESYRCVSDYLAIYENVNGKVVEISKFCGDGNVHQIISMGRNIIVEFSSKRDGTIMHDGFQLTLQETESDVERHPRNCEFIYRSTDRGSKDNIKSFQHWYPPSTLCSYRFVGKTSEKVFVQLKIIRNDIDTLESSYLRRNTSLNYCPGNEIAVYNGAFSNDSLAWSYCDFLHHDINNIQVPVTSTGNVLLVQYYSSRGSLNGQEFTYGITYKFVKKIQNWTHKRNKPAITLNETRTISLKPVNFSALNLTEYENCNCDFSSRIGTFKSWFIVLVILGVISFLGAVMTIVALLMKCLKLRSMEKKLLQTPKR